MKDGDDMKKVKTNIQADHNSSDSATLSVKTRTTSELRAIKALGCLHSKERPWADIEKELGFNRGYLNLVANGKRRASYRLMVKLGVLKGRNLKPRKAIWQRESERKTRALVSVWAIIWGEKPKGATDAA